MFNKQAYFFVIIIHYITIIIKLQRSLLNKCPLWRWYIIECNLDYLSLVSGTSITQTIWTSESTHVQQKAWPTICGCGNIIIEWWSTNATHFALGKSDYEWFFSEHCCTVIIYRLDIINQLRNAGTSVFRTFHLSTIAAIRLQTSNLS